MGQAPGSEGHLLRSMNGPDLALPWCGCRRSFCLQSFWRRQPHLQQEEHR